MIREELLEILACPLCDVRPPFSLETVQGLEYLVCTECGSGFPIQDDIPHLLPENAIEPKVMKDLLDGH